MKFEWITFWIVVVLLVVIYAGSYLVAVSDLPDWFKFFLLK